MNDIITKLRAVIANATSACVPGEGYCLACEGQGKLRVLADPTTAALFVDLLEEAKWFADQPGTAALSGAIDAIHTRLEGKL
jgi:hypothetical protein